MYTIFQLKRWRDFSGNDFYDVVRYENHFTFSFLILFDKKFENVTFVSLSTSLRAITMFRKKTQKEQSIANKTKKKTISNIPVSSIFELLIPLSIFGDFIAENTLYIAYLIWF